MRGKRPKMYNSRAGGAATDAAPASESTPSVDVMPPAPPTARGALIGAAVRAEEDLAAPPAAASDRGSATPPGEAAAGKDSGVYADAELVEDADCSPVVASVTKADDDFSSRGNTTGGTVEWAESPMRSPARRPTGEPRRLSSYLLSRDRKGSVCVRDSSVSKIAALAYYRDCVALTGEIFDAIDAALHSGPDFVGDAARLNVFEMFAVMKYIDVHDRAIIGARATEDSNSGDGATIISSLDSFGQSAAATHGGERSGAVHPVVPARRITGTQTCLEDLSGRISLAIRLLSGGDLFPPLKLRVFPHEFAEVLFHVTNIRPLRLQASGENAEPRLACFVGTRRRRLVEALSGEIDATQLRAFTRAVWEENAVRKNLRQADVAMDLESRWPTIRREMTFKKLRKPDREVAAEMGLAMTTVRSKSFVRESHSDDDDTDNAEEGDVYRDREAVVASNLASVEEEVAELSLLNTIALIFRPIDAGQNEEEQANLQHVLRLNLRRHGVNVLRKVTWYSIPFFLVLLWLCTGTLWYHFFLKWDFLKSFYYAVQAGLSVGFGSLSEEKKNDGTPWCAPDAAAATSGAPGGAPAPGDAMREHKYRNDGICWTSDISKMYTAMHVLVGAAYVGAALSLFMDFMMTRQSEWDAVQTKQRKADRAEMRKREAADKLQRRLETHRAATSEARAASDSGLTLEGLVSFPRRINLETSQKSSVSGVVANVLEDVDHMGDDLADDVGTHIVDVLTPHEDANADEAAPTELPRARACSRAFVTGVRAHIIEEWRSVIVFVLFFFWVGVGVFYGMVVEEWSFCTAFYFAVTSMSTGGLQGPTPGEGGRNMGFVALYCLVGVPMFGAFVGSLGSSFFTIIFRRTDETPLSTLDMYSREVCVSLSFASLFSLFLYRFLSFSSVFASLLSTT